MDVVTVSNLLLMVFVSYNHLIREINLAEMLAERKMWRFDRFHRTRLGLPRSQILASTLHAQRSTVNPEAFVLIFPGSLCQIWLLHASKYHPQQLGGHWGNFFRINKPPPPKKKQQFFFSLLVLYL